MSIKESGNEAYFTINVRDRARTHTLRVLPSFLLSRLYISSVVTLLAQSGPLSRICNVRWLTLISWELTVLLDTDLFCNY
jgi:hypothetical protein